MWFIEIVYPIYYVFTQRFNANGAAINASIVKSASNMMPSLHFIEHNGEQNLPMESFKEKYSYFFIPMINSPVNGRGYQATGDNRGLGFADIL